MRGKPRTEQEALLFIKPILPLLQRGMSEKQACEYAKIPEATMNDYKRKFESVRSEIKHSKMALIAVASDTVAKAAQEDAKIALEVLKRRSKESWGDSVDVTSNGETVGRSVEVVWATKKK